MAYIRDDKTGKFSWVEGTVAEEGDTGYVAPGQRKQPETSPTLLPAAAVILGAVVLIGAWGMSAAKEPNIAIRRIHNHPAEFDGRTVVLKGRVGSVFQVGGSYAYYLLQGRDTIVVFTRGGRPTPGPNTKVHGSISIGYLDGVARPALFATN